MVGPSHQFVFSTESKRSLKRKWKGVMKPAPQCAKKQRTLHEPLSFSEEEYLLGKPNELIPLVVSARILNLDVECILVDQNSPMDVLFQDLLPKIGVSLSDLHPYHGPRVVGYGPNPVELVEYLAAFVTFGEGELSRSISIAFVVIPLITPYHGVLGRPTLAGLGAVASAVHLKMKFLSAEGKVASIPADLVAVKRSQFLALKGIRLHPQVVSRPPRSSERVLLTKIDARYDPYSSDEEERRRRFTLSLMENSNPFR